MTDAERLRHNAAVYRERHPERVVAQTAAYNKRHKKQLDAKQAIICRTINGRFIHGKSAAKRRGFIWNITFLLFVELLSEPCRYCGGPLNPTGYGLDRQNNRRGYEPDNVVPCCGSCNEKKGCFEWAGFAFPRTVELLLEVIVAHQTRGENVN